MLLRLNYKMFLIACLILVGAGCKKDYDQGVVTPPVNGGKPVIDWAKAADSSTLNLLNKFWNVSGNYFNEKNNNTNFNYWPQAHGLDVLVDAYNRTSNPL